MRISLVLAALLFVCALSLNGEAAESLILYFSFAEGTGDTVADQSGNGHEGVLQGGVEWTDGKYGGALSFDGASGYVEVEDDAALDLDGSFSVLAWIYPTMVDGGFRWAVDKGHDNNTLNYLLGISSNNSFRFITRALSNDVTGPAITPDNWYHLAGVQDDTTNEVILYLDGAAVASSALAGEKVVNDATLKIGCREWLGSATQFFGGKLDEVAILSRALTEAEVQTAMQGVEGIIAAVNPCSCLAVTWGDIKAK
jgi:hypothetical protein